MALERKNWTLNTYANAAWSDLVSEEAILATILIANTDLVNPVVVGIQIADGTDASLAVIVPGKTLAAGESVTIDIRSINLITGQKLQVQADAAGANFLASGVVSAP